MKLPPLPEALSSELKRKKNGLLLPINGAQIFMKAGLIRDSTSSDESS